MINRSNVYNRPLSKLIFDKEFIGDEARRTAVYSAICEDLSAESTNKLPAEGEFRKRSNVIKFQSPFERLKLYNTLPDISLRKAIITQAIIDATNISELPTEKKWAQEAKTWIFTDCDHFKEICMEAGIEPSFVVKITTEIIKLHKNKLRFRGLKKKIKKDSC